MNSSDGTRGNDGEPNSLAGHLTALGLDKHAGQIYLHLLRTKEWTVEALRKSLEMDEEGISHGLSLLAQSQLIITDETGCTVLHTVSPQLGLSRLIESHSRKIQEEEEGLETARRASAAIIDLSRVAAGQNAGATLEVIEGRFGVTDKLGVLLRNAEREVVSMIAELPQVETLAHVRKNDGALLDRGIASRLLVLEGHLRVSLPFYENLQFLSEKGAEIRVAPSLPVRMVIVDRSKAVLPNDPTRATAGAVVLDHPVIVALLGEIFDRVWKDSRPLLEPVVGAGDRWVPSPLDLEILRLLAMGMKDEAIARRIGMSLRSVRRIVSGIASSLEVESRFQMGATCFARGLLEDLGEKPS